MTKEEITVAIAALPEDDQAAVVTSLIFGGLQRASELGKLPDLVGQALGSYGIAIFTLDESGAHLVDGWSDDGPRGAHVNHIMDQVHNAIAAVLDTELDRNEVESS